MDIRFGHRSVDFPGRELGEMRSSNSLLSDTSGLMRRMAAEGYLLLRGLTDRGKVLKAREAILSYMEESGALLSNT